MRSSHNSLVPSDLSLSPHIRPADSIMVNIPDLSTLVGNVLHVGNVLLLLGDKTAMY